MLAENIWPKATAQMANMQIAQDEDPNVAEKVTQVIGSHSIYYISSKLICDTTFKGVNTCLDI